MGENDRKPVVLAVGAHPDDIEFMMAGTLILLGESGWAVHYMNIANGSCGTAVDPREAIIEKRRKEAQDACGLIGAVFHESLCDDLMVKHSPELVRKVLAVVRRVRPRILLTPSPQDYMEDHINASRLVVTAAFARGMRNYPSDPPLEPIQDGVTLYHALPYGLRGPLREKIQPGQYVDISAAMEKKRRMLACHRSQKEWLDASQGFNAYVETMVSQAREAGGMSGRFAYAEGWRKRLHLGFCGPDDDPLKDALGDGCWVDPRWEAG